MLVEVPRWTPEGMRAVAAAPHISTWREADQMPTQERTEISLDLEATTDAKARRLVRATLGNLDFYTFKASTGGPAAT